MVDFKTHWIFDQFYPEASGMRQKIDDHFTESVARHSPFEQRAIWNYWWIPTLYMYFRARPEALFTEPMFEAFMVHLRAFVAKQFGLIINTRPFISMYVNGCGQNIHNDFGNGRLAYVFSLTKWAERKFIGGETFLYHLGSTAHEKFLKSTGGWGWYDFVEPHFNRLALFDDRLPHAVNYIHGTMEPWDARFVLHGHMEESDTVAYSEGGLKGVDVKAPFAKAKEAIRDMFKAHGLDGFISVEQNVNAAGVAGQMNITTMQLVQMTKDAKDVSVALDDAKEILSKITWPTAGSESKLVFALGAAPLR